MLLNLQMLSYKIFSSVHFLKLIRFLQAIFLLNIFYKSKETYFKKFCLTNFSPVLDRLQLTHSILACLIIMKGKVKFIVMMSYTIMAQDISFWILQFSGLFKRTKDLILRLIQEDPDTLCLGVSIFAYLPYIPLCSFIFLLAIFRVILRHKTFWFIQLDHEKAGKIVLTGIISFTGFFLLLIWLIKIVHVLPLFTFHKL